MFHNLKCNGFITFLTYFSLGLGDVVPADLDPRLQEGFGHFVDVDAQQVGDLLSNRVVRKNGLKKVHQHLETIFGGYDP